jgi:hypothetical protein
MTVCSYVMNVGTAYLLTRIYSHFDIYAYLLYYMDLFVSLFIPINTILAIFLHKAKIYMAMYSMWKLLLQSFVFHIILLPMAILSQYGADRLFQTKIFEESVLALSFTLYTNNIYLVTVIFCTARIFLLSYYTKCSCSNMEENNHYYMTYEIKRILRIILLSSLVLLLYYFIIIALHLM